MSKTANTIVSEIEKYATENCSGNAYTDYYIGITKDIEKRLFTEHKVEEKGGCWIWISAKDIDNARAAEKALLDRGMNGGDGGGGDTSVYVYCYLITDYTEE